MITSLGAMWFCSLSFLRLFVHGKIDLGGRFPQQTFLFGILSRVNCNLTLRHSVREQLQIAEQGDLQQGWKFGLRLSFPSGSYLATFILRVTCRS